MRRPETSGRHSKPSMAKSSRLTCPWRTWIKKGTGGTSPPSGSRRVQVGPLHHLDQEGYRWNLSTIWIKKGTGGTSPPSGSRRVQVEPLHHLDQEGYRWDLSTIHKDLAKQATAYMSSLWPADALSRPEVNMKEKQLPRKTKCTLVQLQSGYSIFLNSYRIRIDPDVKDQYPECSGSPYDISHLFNRSKRPTNLEVECLWLHPRKTATIPDGTKPNDM